MIGREAVSTIWSAVEIARTIDHTLLMPEATAAEIDLLCEEALACGFAGVCINPVYVARAARNVSDRPAARRPAVVSVAGFPFGATHTGSKADEAQRALDDGADEIDMVIHIAALIAGDKSAVRNDIETLAHVVHRHHQGALLKVILETGVLTADQIILGCRCAAEGEADFVKTSTGFHASGAATVEHVRLLHKHAAPIRVKASGGIHTAAQAVAMLHAGAARIGTSAGVGILRELGSKSV
jgi:deoxyribose-phosphate aldolase